MNPGGLVLIVFSIIGISQLFAGNALERLKILPSTAGQAPSSTSPLTTGAPGSPSSPVGPFGVAPFGDHGGTPAPGTVPQAV